MFPRKPSRLVKVLKRYFYAVRHVERRPATSTKRGRPSRWRREDLVSASGHLRALLQRETSGRVSLNSFIGQYLQILDFPSDVQERLASNQINLQEAAHLARLSPERLGCTTAEARRARGEIMQAHLAVQGSQTRLRTKLKELLGEATYAHISSGDIASVVANVDELLEVDPGDARHMFWEEMRRLFFAMKEVEPEDLDEETMDDFLRAMDEVSNILCRIKKRRRKRRQATAKLSA
jgi:hypothetical protein